MGKTTSKQRCTLEASTLYLEEAIQSIHHCSVREDLSEPPTEEEVLEAMGTLKGRKAGGQNGILPEMMNAVMEMCWITSWISL